MRKGTPVYGKIPSPRIFLTGSRAWCFWGDQLSQNNEQFLKALDPRYFTYVAGRYSEDLSGEDRHRAATALRMAHGQAMEMLLALIGAAAQAPDFPLGWMLRYEVGDLREVVGALSGGKKIEHRLVAEVLTWDSVAEAIFASLKAESSIKNNVAERFAGFWRRLAKMFLSEAKEYPSIKHGLRIAAGGFSMAVGPPRKAGDHHPPEEMQSLGGSEFGTSFFVDEKIEGEPSCHRRTAYHALNWNPNGLMADLELMTSSMSNVITFLRLCNAAGGDGSELLFTKPADDAFDRYRDHLVNLTAAKWSDPYTLPMERLCSAKELRDVYRSAPASEQVDS